MSTRVMSLRPDRTISSLSSRAWMTTESPRGAEYRRRALAVAAILLGLLSAAAVATADAFPRDNRMEQVLPRYSPVQGQLPPLRNPYDCATAPNPSACNSCMAACDRGDGPGRINWLLTCKNTCCERYSPNAACPRWPSRPRQ